jgi:ketol-acid reductoisomerase
MRYSVSDTAQYGDLTWTPHYHGRTRKEMKKFARDQSGEFAKGMDSGNKANRPVFNMRTTRGTAFD